MFNDCMYNKVKLEEYHFSTFESAEQAVKGHRLVINIGNAVNVHWKNSNNKWNNKLYEPGCLSFVPNGQPNEVYCEQNIDIMIIEINQDYIKQTLGINNLELKEVRGIMDNMIYQLALYLREEQKCGKIASKIFSESIIAGLAIQIGTKYNINKKEIYAPKGKLSSTQLKHLIDYCNSNIESDISIEKLSKQVNLSPFHFIRSFKNTVGLTPYQYIVHMRIEKSKQLIKQNKYSLMEIALRLGYSDQSHFSNSFKKIIGITPHDFKKN